MNKICTSLEQSKKLIELGINVNTADMFWDTAEPLERIVPTVGPISDYYDMEDWAIPAWSLSALMNLLPSEFTEVGKYSTTIYVIKIRKYKFTDEVNLHQIAYGSYKWHEDGGYTWSDMINTGEKEDLLDAAFEMVCWLKENGKI
jgi:hypothetical protein